MVKHSGYGLGGRRIDPYFVGIFPLTGLSPRVLKYLGRSCMITTWCLSYGPCLYNAQVDSYTEGLYHVNSLCSMDYSRGLNLAIIALRVPGGRYPSRQ